MNTSFLKVMKHKLFERHFEESLVFVFIGVGSAVVCSAYARLFSLAEESSHHFFHDHPYLSFIVAPLAMVISFLLIAKCAPGAGGS